MTTHANITLAPGDPDLTAALAIRVTLGCSGTLGVATTGDTGTRGVTEMILGALFTHCSGGVVPTVDAATVAQLGVVDAGVSFAIALTLFTLVSIFRSGK